MAFLDSTYIKAYPAVNRNIDVSGDIYSRHTSESTLSSIVNKLIDTKGFVITDRNDFGIDKPFRFNIYGYYFKVEKLEYIINVISNLKENDTVYAGITLQKNGYWEELYGPDELSSAGNYEYRSVIFSKDINEVKDCTYYIPLFKKSETYSWNNTGFYVENSYYLKFISHSFEVDGGDLDIE